MKKIIILLSLLILVPNAGITMEGPDNQNLITPLPMEIKAHIISFIAQAPSLNEAIKNIKKLAIVNKDFNQLIDDEYVGKIITQALIKQFGDQIIIQLTDIIKNAESLENAMIQIHELATNREFFRIINDKVITELILDELVKAFSFQTHNNPIFAALAINNEAAHAWLAKHFEQVKLLIETNSFCLQDEHLSILFKDPKCAKYYAIEYINSMETPGLLALIITGKTALVKDLLQSMDIDLNAITDFLGNNPLLLAAVRADADLIKFLLEKGANPNIGDNLGVTPLMVAINADKLENFYALLQAPTIELNKTSFLDHTALMVAALSGKIEYVKALLKAGANPAIKTPGGQTARDFALFKGYIEIAQLL